MPPARGDHEARRRDVSEAVWRVLVAQGFGGLTLRAVAAEMDASTGLLTHYFPNKRALLRTALEILAQRSEERPRRAAPAEGLAALRAALLDILPLTAESAAANRIWVSSWDVALADPELAAEHAERYRRSRERLTAIVAAAQRLGELPAGTPTDDLAAAAQGFSLGLVVQALFAPAEFPAERQILLLEQWLATWSSAGPGPAQCPPAGTG
ncbi:AcrR family transcriptional regulator [Kitasatospora sp. MAP12-15]|uniref:TetR/AcrR family transcriptional regulator n=1 Tax=unclassified Kitasatospora TaxID=2633591 RepID=UPI002473E83B|nr:TetR family transcriptional regulator C-terminal domain-containing protein [Kitasatospora sp. MAP12-44]MDH6111448.1 AcrR family transcriptional regulator [Kitasatospora sp. MAP12-44]